MKTLGAIRTSVQRIGSLQQAFRIQSLPAKSQKRQLSLIWGGNSPGQSCSQTTNISTLRENCQSELLFQTAGGQISKRKMLVSRFHKSTQLNELNTSFPSDYYLPRHRSSLPHCKSRSTATHLKSRQHDPQNPCLEDQRS